MKASETRLALALIAEAMAEKTGLSTEDAFDALVRGITASTEGLRIYREATHGHNRHPG